MAGQGELMIRKHPSVTTPGETLAARLVKVPDGRTIAVETSGDRRGSPVFLLHGTPGSRLGQAPRGQVLHLLGIHLITLDRPGYGDSDRRPGRRIADAAGDVAAVADALGLDAFGVVGRSGGGPHALACAALLPDRVTRTATLVSLAPREAEGLDWYAGMAESNVRSFANALDGRHHLAPDLQARARDIRADPARMIAALRQEAPESDLRVMADRGVRTMLQINYREALRSHDAGGWIDDVVAINQRWGFDPADIPGPVLLWHGEDDVFVPAEHSRWLAGRIPDSRLEVQPGAAHFGVLRILPAVLRWAAH
jgi:pimeloyl-ACP methyl ester carboxylesterase